MVKYNISMCDTFIILNKIKGGKKTKNKPKKHNLVDRN